MPRVLVQAPFAGQNNKDGVYSLDERFGSQVINFVPGPGYLDVRGPVLEYSTNSLSPLDILSINPNANGSGIFSTSTSIYAVATVIGAPLAAGFANGLWHGNLWQNRTILCNGVDTPQIYDGATVVPIVAAGPTLTNLYGSTTFKGRVYYWENNARVFWYAAAGAFQGALTSFDLSTFTRGDGYLVSIAPLTIDGGAGPDDILAFLFSNGEVLVYQGDDPGSATAWQQVGRFVIGEMLGRDCWTIVGSATLVATSIGVVDLARALSSGAIDDSAVVGQNFGAVNMTVRTSTGTTAGHRKLIFDPKNRLLLMFLYEPSLITTDGMSVVYGMDIESRSWFTAWGVSKEVGILQSSMFGNIKLTTAAGTVGKSVLLGGFGKLLSCFSRSDSLNLPDVYGQALGLSGNILCYGIQNGLDFGVQGLNKACDLVAVNFQKTANTVDAIDLTVILSSGPTTYISGAMTQTIPMLDNLSERKFHVCSMFGTKINSAVRYFGLSGYRWFSSEFVFKVCNTL